jgi:hypothetical protein
MVLKAHVGFVVRKSKDGDERAVVLYAYHPKGLTLPFAYRKYVLGCKGGHSHEQMGLPGRCVACLDERVSYLPASIRIAG